MSTVANLFFPFLLCIVKVRVSQVNCNGDLFHAHDTHETFRGRARLLVVALCVPFLLLLSLCSISTAVVCLLPHFGYTVFESAQTGERPQHHLLWPEGTKSRFA